LGLRPRPRWGSLQRSPRHLVGGLLLRGEEGTGGEGRTREGRGRGPGGRGEIREREKWSEWIWGRGGR